MSDSLSQKVIEILITAQNETSAAIEEAAGELEGLQASMMEVGQNLLAVGAGMFGAGAALAGALGLAVDAASSYQTMMTDIQNNTNMSDAATQQMAASVRQLALDTGAPLDQLASGYMHIVNVTGDATNAQAILKVATESAVSTGADASAVANTLAQAMHEYGADTSTAADAQTRFNDIQQNATTVMGMYHLAAAESNSEVSDFADKTARATGVAANLHVPLDQLLASLTALNKHGFPDLAEAQTQAVDLMNKIVNPTKAASSAIDELSKKSGVDLVSDFTAEGLASKGLTGILGDLHEAYSNLGYNQEQVTQSAEQLINAQRGGLGLAVLLGTGARDYSKTLADLNNQQLINSVTDDSYARTQETLGNEVDRVKNEVLVTAQALGDALLPSVQDTLASILPTIDAVRQWISVHADLIDSLASGVATFLMVGGAILAITGLVTMLIAAINPLTLVIAALSLAWANNWSNIRDVAAGAAQTILAAIETLAGYAVGGFDAIEGGLVNLSAAFNSVLGGILDTVESVGQEIYQALSWLNPFATHSPSLVSQVTDGVQVILDQYERTGQVAAPLEDTGRQIEQFASMGKAALQSLADTTKASVDDMKNQLDTLKSALKAAKSDLRDLSSTPIQGTKAFEDQKFALEQQKEQVQLQIDQAKLAGADSKALKPLQDELNKLGLQADAVNLQEKLKLDPLKRQIDELARPTKELPFDQIVAGIKKAQANIATLTPAIAQMQHAYDAQNATLKEQQQALQQVNQAASAARGAFGGAGGAAKGLGSSLKGVGDSLAGMKGGLDALGPSLLSLKTALQNNGAPQATKAIHDIATAHEEAREQAEADTNAHATWAANVSAGASIVQTAYQTAMPAVSAAIGTVVDFVQANWPTIQQVVDTVMTDVQGVIQTVLAAVVPFVQSEVNQITNWWINNLPLIQRTVTTVMNAVQAVTTFVLNIVHGLWQTFGATIVGLVQTDWQLIQLVIQVAMELIGQIITFAWQVIEVVVDTYIHEVLDLITLVMDVITGNWQGAWDTVQDMLSTAWTAMGNIVKDGVNLIIGFINDLIGAWDAITLSIPGFSITLPSINVPGVGTVGGGSLSWSGFHESATQIPQIPALAAGGIVTSPTLALIGEAGPEAVVPLSSGGGGAPNLTINVNVANSTVTNKAAMRELTDEITKAILAKYNTMRRV